MKEYFVISELNKESHCLRIMVCYDPCHIAKKGKLLNHLFPLFFQLLVTAFFYCDFMQLPDKMLSPCYWYAGQLLAGNPNCISLWQPIHNPKSPSIKNLDSATIIFSRKGRSQGLLHKHPCP